jgi:hypothetical protein
MEPVGSRPARFLFPTESDGWLTVLRIGLAVETVLYCLSFRNDWNYLLGASGGLNSRDLAEKILSLESPLVPRLGWLVELGVHVGLREETILSGVWLVLLCAGVGLLFGFFSRFSAILAWFLHLCAAKSGGVLSYGVDNFMTIGLFYLMLSPSSDRWSLDKRWRKSRPQDRSANGWIRRGEQIVGFFRRMLQVHLCVIYFFGGLTKCLGSGWWDGSNLWRALIRPPFNVVDPEILVRWKYLFPVAGVVICLLEISYPFFIWGRSTRKIWLLSICGMHIAIGLTMGMYLFALIMIVLNVAAFAPGIAFPKISATAASNQEGDGANGKLQAAI